LDSSLTRCFWNSWFFFPSSRLWQVKSQDCLYRRC
jgi:hypothetical protein